MWTNISYYAINHCSNRGFDLVEARGAGPTNCVAVYLWVLFGGAALRVNPTCAITGQSEFPGFDTLSWSKCQKEQKEWDAVEDMEEEGCEWQTDLPPCLQISEGHTASFPLPLMQRFQDNRLMGKTTTTWLTLAPELETELMWKSDYYPVSAHIPASDFFIPAEKQNNRRWGAKRNNNIPTRCTHTHNASPC